MARRRSKKRTHVGAKNPITPTAITGHASIKDPKSMVIRIGAGEVGSSISQLAADVRRVMEPGTASRLKERRANRLRDYATMCGPLGVTHLLLFSRSPSGNTNLRLATAPRGPTFHFRVEKYSLAKDVKRAQRHPKGGGKEYITPPLLVMNNFITPGADAKSAVPKHLESLTTTAFQSLFPPINPQTTPLKSIRRVLLLNREPAEDGEDGSFVVNFRHYAITTKTVGISKPLKRLNAAEKLLHGHSTGKKGSLPNLSKLQDIADYMIGGEGGDGYMTDGGGTSASEYETDAEVEVLEASTRKVLTSKARSAAAAAAAAAEAGEEGKAPAERAADNVERRAVKMVELGPRMRLRMTKVEEGLCEGKVLWHEYKHKSPEEIRELEKKWEQRRREKDARKKEQKQNVEKKKAAKQEARKANGGKKGDDDDEDEDEMDVDSDGYGYEDGFDSEGLEGDAEEQVNATMEKNGEWEDEEAEIAAG
ncbi:Brix-domain-containing protein [Coniochaeta ligniaria NRRL 30616]|uniref:Brix-domain-containing protein n=1 Tax=Coniochaeta ligniaria NRRL 30616 TaxID=1408157 RepID=A0A1J7IX59_9PEZI|nr:Brix-domain-containing protein [Coniochaeta ligniaria NRRL 30616]